VRRADDATQAWPLPRDRIAAERAAYRSTPRPPANFVLGIETSRASTGCASDTSQVPTPDQGLRLTLNLRSGAMHQRLAEVRFVHIHGPVSTRLIPLTLGFRL
jgi:hypothetical protein